MTTPDPLDTAANLGAWLKSFCDATDPLPADFLADRQNARAQERHRPLPLILHDPTHKIYN